MNQNRAFKGVWIPADVWLDESLTVMEKLFMVEIDSLDNDEGCYASNAHFADFFGLSKNRCSAIISSLVDKGRITSEMICNGKQVEKRVLRVFRKQVGGIPKTGRGYSENSEGNNTTNNTTTKDSLSGKKPDEKNKPPKYTEDDIALANYMLTKIQEVSEFAKRGKSWPDDIRLMRERDGHTLEGIRAMFDWANSDAFWRSNILSPGKLRQKWVQLDAKRGTQPASQPEDEPTDEQGLYDKYRPIGVKLGIGLRGDESNRDYALRVKAAVAENNH